MNKLKNIILAIIFIFILFILAYYNCIKSEMKNNYENFAINIDGMPASAIPAKGDYNVIVNCENANGKWLYDTWELDISGIEGNFACSLDFMTKENSISIDDYLVSLNNTVQGEGKLLYEYGYRYEGKNPNNYILFNNEVWRIIGVFDITLSNGHNADRLVKLMKMNSIGNVAIDKADSNNWPASDLYTILNSYYINATNGTGTYCYTYGSSISGICNYINNGISSTYRNMIENVTWYLGGNGTDGINANQFYVKEREQPQNSNPAVSIGKVGLMYPSDYAFSVLADSCSRSTTISGYGKNECAGKSWIFMGEEWTITPNTGWSTKSYSISKSGTLQWAGNVNSANPIRPVLYLKSSVKLYGGDGSPQNPYQIYM